jgi:hypothetical protein
MAIPNPPMRPPLKGNSQQQVVPHETAQQKARPKEMHPAVAEAMGRYAQIWEENDELRTENGNLQKENDVLRKLDAEKSALIESLRIAITEAQRVTDQRLSTQEAYYRERLAEAERAKERYLRYAVSISTDIKACITSLEAADTTAMEMAHSPGEKALKDIDTAIEEAARAVEQRSTSVDQLQIPKP